VPNPPLQQNYAGNVALVVLALFPGRAAPNATGSAKLNPAGERSMRR